jgi:sulfur relay (sulfurtransferase) DsrC/TusE family protein
MSPLGPSGNPLPAEWTPARAEAIARRAGLAALRDRHWRVIASCREEFARTGRTPDLAQLSKLTGLDRRELAQLFPGDPEALIGRISGCACPGPGASRASGPTWEESS